MKVDTFRLTYPGTGTAAPPRVWRIATPEGVFWLAQDGAAARLLHLPDDDGAESAPQDQDTSARSAALALAAETQAASRWVRQGVSPVADAPTFHGAEADPPR